MLSVIKYFKEIRQHQFRRCKVKRIGIDIDTIVRLRDWSGKKTPDPVHVIALLEAAGVDSIVYTLRNEETAYTARDMGLLHECIHSHFNLRFYPGESSVQTALKSKAGMLTIVDFDGPNVTAINLLSKESAVAPMISYLRGKGAIVSALIEPSADQIKAAVRMQCDYVELDTSKYSGAENLGDMERELENLKIIAAATAKYNIGIIASGNLDMTNIQSIADIPEIEEINVAQTFFNRAILVGISHAVKDFKSLV